jgi:hypothetical protein
MSLMDYIVFDTDNKLYTIKDVEKLIKDNINPHENYHKPLFCSYCNNPIYFREATPNRSAQLCHFKNQSCFIKQIYKKKVKRSVEE